DSDPQGKKSIEYTGPGRGFLSENIAMTTYPRPCSLASLRRKRSQRTYRRGIPNRSATLKRPGETRRAIETDNHKEILPPAVKRPVLWIPSQRNMLSQPPNYNKSPHD